MTLTLALPPASVPTFLALPPAPARRKRGGGRPVGRKTEQSVVPVYKGIPVSLSCLMCGRDFGQFDMARLPRGRFRCGFCGGRVLMSDGGPLTAPGEPDAVHRVSSTAGLRPDAQELVRGKGEMLTTVAPVRSIPKSARRTDLILGGSRYRNNDFWN